MTDDIVARLREIEDSTYGLSLSPTQVRRIAGKAADRIEKLEKRIGEFKSAVQNIKDDDNG